MRSVEMTKIRRAEIEVPGGWIAKVPEVELRARDVPVMLARVQRRGVSAMHSPRELAARMQEVFERGWVRELRKSIAARAEEYVEIHGELWGFDPEVLQKGYFPGDNFGRRGKQGVRRLLVEMGREHEEGKVS